ncbi:PDGLE domain-containing protein [Gordonia sp. ABSL1-1]|uniref:PDGLE domain-containing protein n=1 Tax=Gordonia sp. ABSL1-1 TaxID=3053923 RepID=UPI002573A1E7|nr:PDGLE domain-containing protein [Gordonia sp. ABSL1-1]MDL9937018.1 PDGLE domain-containing protein [Gordonia sp. ABSL1-1]
MSATRAGHSRMSRRWFLVGFGIVALLIAGIVSYAASASPDGLDAATTRGCQTVEVNGAEQLVGTCIAQHADDHRLNTSPLADYSVRGIAGTNGVAGIVGVLVTLAVAGGLFWLLARGRRSGSGSGS